MKRIITALLFWVSIISLSAQTERKILTFEEAIKIALRNSVLLNQQRNNLELNQMQKVSSVSAIAPNVSVNLSASQYNGNSFNPNSGVVVNGVRDNVSSSLNANMNLFSGFNRINSIKQSSFLVDAQANFVHRTTQDVINAVSIQYLQVMLDVELIKIAKENFEALSKQLEQTKEQVKVGARSPVDEYNQDALTKGAELRHVQAEIAFNNDKALLSQTMLIDAFEEFDVERPNWDINTIGNETLDPQALAEKAKQYRGDYLRAVHTESAQRFAMKASKGLMIPSLYAFFNYGSAFNYQHGVADSLQRSFKDQFRQDNIYKQYGAQLSIPIFSGLQSRTTFVQQKTLYDNAQLNRKNVEYQIRNDVLRVSRNYEGAKKAYTVTMEQLKAADLAFNLETERYNLGVTNFVDYINANRVFVQAQTEKAQAEYRLLFQRVLIDYAVGTLKPEDLE
jgi:outer membrane protein